MDVPSEKQYENVTNHLRYLNEKIIDAFSRFITLATAIIGGVFYIHINLALDDPRRKMLNLPASAALMLVGFGTVVLILSNLHAWIGYRKMLSREYPSIPLKTGINWYLSETIMCLLILITCIAFYFLNPL